MHVLVRRPSFIRTSMIFKPNSSLGVKLLEKRRACPCVYADTPKVQQTPGALISRFRAHCIGFPKSATSSVDDYMSPMRIQKVWTQEEGFLILNITYNRVDLCLASYSTKVKFSLPTLVVGRIFNREHRLAGVEWTDLIPQRELAPGSLN